MPQKKPQRKLPRLQGYDYTQEGAYFVTVCTHLRQHRFGKVTNDKIVLNQLGQIAYDEMVKLPQRRQSVDVDLFVIMPNHLHTIILIEDGDSNQASNTNKTILGNIIGAYKAGVTRQISRIIPDFERPLWQMSFHDHIIRNEPDLNRLRQYILTNPAKWVEDRFYSEA